MDKLACYNHRGGCGWSGGVGNMEITKEGSMKEVSIQSIKILMGKHDVELSIEEAKKLKSALEEIFGKTTVEKTEHIHHYDWFRHWYQPITGTVYCQASNSTNSTANLCVEIR